MEASIIIKGDFPTILGDNRDKSSKNSKNIFPL